MDASAPADAGCDAGGRSCGVCGLQCGAHAFCEPDAGQCRCALGHQDCNGNLNTDGCEEPLAFQSPDWTFYSTLQDPEALQTPVVGPTARLNGLGTGDFVAGIVGSGLRIDETSPPGSSLEIPNDVTAMRVFDTDRGAIRFWYAPDYFAEEAVVTSLIRCSGAAGESFEITHPSGGGLYVKFQWVGDNVAFSIPHEELGWKPGEWVHVEVFWRAAGSWGLKYNEELLWSGSFPTLSSFTVCNELYVGNSPGGDRPARGVIDELMFLNSDVYELNTVCP
jgi:hypothetical protein